MPSILQLDERNRLVMLVARLPDFTDFGVVGRRGLVRAAGLDRFLPGIQWDLADRIVAGALISRLDDHDFLPERPQYHALAALMCYLLELPEAGQDDKVFMAGLIVKYGLVRDPVYLSNLRTQYGIAASPPAITEPGMARPAVALPADLPEPSFEPRIADAAALERTLNSEDNFLDLFMLFGAIYSAAAVGRVELSFEQALGTGWLIGPDLLLTNKHVLPSQEYVAEAQIRFGYRRDLQGVSQEGRPYRLDPDFYYFSPEEELDYALVRLTEKPLQEMQLTDADEQLSIPELIRQRKHRGYLLPAPRQLLNLQRVNIIQHPAGDPLKVVLTQNLVTRDMDATRVYYRVDTKKGSSGAPVFNLLWEVVALHRSGPQDSTEAGADQPQTARRTIADNQGVPMKAILQDFRDRQTDTGQPLIRLLPQAK